MLPSAVHQPLLVPRMEVAVDNFLSQGTYTCCCWLLKPKLTGHQINCRSGETSSAASPTDARRRPSSVSISCTMPGLGVTFTTITTIATIATGLIHSCFHLRSSDVVHLTWPSCQILSSCRLSPQPGLPSLRFVIIKVIEFISHGSCYWLWHQQSRGRGSGGAERQSGSFDSQEEDQEENTALVGVKMW